MGRISGGFTQASWSSDFGFATDSEAFLFTLDHQKLFRPLDHSMAILNHPGHGPIFGGPSLTLLGESSPNLGMSYKNGYGEYNYYNIPTDRDGNNILTGDGNYT